MAFKLLICGVSYLALDLPGILKSGVHSFTFRGKSISKNRIWRIELKNQKNNGYLRVIRLLFYLYIIVLFYFLFFSEQFGRDIRTDGYRCNLELFKEIKRYINYQHRVGSLHFIINIYGNIIAFAPFGFLLPLLSKANWTDNSFVMKRKVRGFFTVLLSGMFFSVTIEVIQLVFQVGIFDVDDILMNTVGGLIGYLFFLLCNWVVVALRRKKRKGERYEAAKTSKTK